MMEIIEAIDLKQIPYEGYIIMVQPPRKSAWILRNGGVVDDWVSCPLQDDIVQVARERIDEKVTAKGENHVTQR
jgi:hypothetical protein